MTHLWAAYRRAFTGLPPSVWWLSLVLLLNRAGTMVLTFLALWITQELGHPMTVAGSMLSLYGLGHLTGAFLGGWLCDHLGPIRIQAAALFFSGLAFLALEHTTSLPAIGLTLFLAATAAESFRPANAAVLVSFAPDGLQTRAVALNRLALNLGFSVGPAIGGLLATLDYAWLFRVDGLTCVLSAGLLVYLQKSGRLEPSAHEASRAAADSGRHPLADRAFLFFLAIAFGFAFIFYQGWGPYSVYLKEVYGLDEAVFGGLMAINAISILLFEMVLTHRAESFPALRVIGFGSFLIGAGFAVVTLGTGLALAVLSVLVWTVGEMLALPFAGGWVARRASVRHRGKFMGLYTMSWGLAFVFAPVAGAYVYEHWSPEALWWLVGGVGLGVWAASEALLRRQTREASPSPAG